MNRTQQTAIACGLVLMLVVAVIPPWREDEVVESPNISAYSVDRPISRGLFWRAPRSPAHDVPGRIITDPSIDAGRLLAEIVIVASFTGLIVVALGLASTRRGMSTRDVSG